MIAVMITTIITKERKNKTVCFLATNRFTYPCVQCSKNKGLRCY